ncbi:MAG: response regulator [Proteobacteria bacterium]|nr:response regulator [Pseudomonadota bacterium]
MKILIVEDSKTAAQQLSQIISGLPGFEVIGIAGNGAEGLKLFKQLSPDIICMDIVMPVMDGLQSLRAILQQDSDAKVVVISSVGGVGGKVVEALKFGAKSVISKPFEPDQVREALEGC